MLLLHDIHLGDHVAPCIYLHAYICLLSLLVTKVPCELGLPSHLFTDVLACFLLCGADIITVTISSM